MCDNDTSVASGIRRSSCRREGVGVIAVEKFTSYVCKSHHNYSNTNTMSLINDAQTNSIQYTYSGKEALVP